MRWPKRLGTRRTPIARHTASDVMRVGWLPALDLIAGGLSALIPEAGSPFAMTFGGVAARRKHEGGSPRPPTASASVDAKPSPLRRALRPTSAPRRRRGQNEKQLADDDVKTRPAADGRADPPRHRQSPLDLHQKSIRSDPGFLDFTDGKFTRTSASTPGCPATLQGLYRGAYQNALALANLAEQALAVRARRLHRRPGSRAPDRDRHLRRPARRRAAAHRPPDPRAPLHRDQLPHPRDRPSVLALADRRRGASSTCARPASVTFDRPRGLLLDLFYPGHYKRRIKAVRLTIPCVTGPYIERRRDARSSGARSGRRRPRTSSLVPPTRTVRSRRARRRTTRASSSCPSATSATCPSRGWAPSARGTSRCRTAFRQFDYQTINDVILSISYVAELDGRLREDVQSKNLQAANNLFTYFSDPSTPARRAFSLRYEFPTVYQLPSKPLGTPVEFGSPHDTSPSSWAGEPSRSRKRRSSFKVGAAWPSTAFS